MYDYSAQIETFHASKVVLPEVMQGMLYAHRTANRDRLITRLPDLIPGVSISDSSFRPQGSVATKTVIQTLFDDEEYDIDDGLVIARSQLEDEDGDALSPKVVRERVKAALEDARFKQQPALMTNCVRVFYADTGAAKHHVDIPIYRKWTRDDGTTVRELAGESSWLESDPTQVTRWFENTIADRNRLVAGRGTQLRQLVRLTKRFCRSRETWLELLPNGMKLTMLVVECQGAHDDRLDLAFRSLLQAMQVRLQTSKVIRNLAHADQPAITRTQRDANVVALLERIDAAVAELDKLDEHRAGLREAREAWDWIFQSDGFFEELDAAFQAESILDSVSMVGPLGVPWAHPLPWPFVQRNRVHVSARHSLRAGGWREFASGTPLVKDLSLKFEPTTDVRGAHNVYWQIINTGNEALRARCMRGEIIEPDQSTRSGTWTETTAYAGCHSVECFIVQHGVCVARSGRFLVVVR